MNTAHDEREAFALLDDAIHALSAIARHHDSDPDAVPGDAVLIVGVQRVDDDGAPVGHRAHVGHVELFPRAGAQPANTHRLINAGRKLLDQVADAGDQTQGG